MNSTQTNVVDIHHPVTVSVIVPYFNEQAVLEIFHQRLLKAIKDISETFEVIYIDDGSDDSSLSIVESLPPSSVVIRSIALSRNFGKEAAMSAGLAVCQGQCAIIIDADLQDPPESIPLMMDKWRQGFDVVNMVRRKRDGETWFKTFSAKCFYKLINAISSTPMVENVGDFRLISRPIIDQLNQLPEKNRYMKGLFSWPGFNHCQVYFDRDSRVMGHSKWGYVKLLALAMDGITAFSTAPLRMASIVGALCVMSTIVVFTRLTILSAWYGETISALSWLSALGLLLFGFTFLFLGLIGEYVGRTLVEAQNRPLYVIKSATKKPPTYQTHSPYADSATSSVTSHHTKQEEKRA
ncbi:MULTISPECIES: glycosyltransferase family 2 protein [unclassified Vibrio]|uniref:Glycosyltransferase family 2 protein n=1 Tax=Vibrio sp. HB236076 TaxID=3232307 RepID=A0AB39HKT0_9VIBR|nr:glycosyltransferase family 2 protein [Vibrio sp. HB161653]MDP5253158.1 glycosyltransferase family 2 protein [Vibrio sp. HB161653]